MIARGRRSKICEREIKGPTIEKNGLRVVAPIRIIFPSSVISPAHMQNLPSPIQSVPAEKNSLYFAYCIKDTTIRILTVSGENHENIPLVHTHTGHSSYSFSRAM